MSHAPVPAAFQSASCLANPVVPGISHAECLKAIWKLSNQSELEEGTRIREVLRMAAATLRMDLVIFGRFGQNHTLHYVHDVLNVVSEGMVVQLQDSMCTEVYTSKAALHVADLRLHPVLQHHRLVTEAGMRVYSGIPVQTGATTEWVLAFLRQSLSPAIGEDDTIYMELIADWLGNALHDSEQKELLKRLALTDPLTDLPNRRAAEDRLQQELARSQRKQGGFAIAMVDLDHFRHINERYGHATGDQVLKTISQR